MTQAWEQLLDAESIELLQQCRACKATCCTYITIQIDDPGDDIDEWEAVRWYLTRPNTTVYVDDEGDWHVQIGERCRFLQEDWTCGIYDKRPSVCADHDPKGCEYWGDPEADYQHVWRSFEAFDEHYQTSVKPTLVKKQEREAKRRSARARKAAKARWAKHRAETNGKNGTGKPRRPGKR